MSWAALLVVVSVIGKKCKCRWDCGHAVCCRGAAMKRTWLKRGVGPPFKCHDCLGLATARDGHNNVRKRPAAVLRRPASAPIVVNTAADASAGIGTVAHDEALVAVSTRLCTRLEQRQMSFFIVIVFFSPRSEAVVPERRHAQWRCGGLDSTDPSMRG